MPLVKNARTTTDPFVHVADGAELPGDGDILISAQRFLADAEALLRRPGKTGVIWPNNRSVEDLVPYLDRVAAVALVFPSFRDGRAYSQARLLRERHGYEGELRATGQVLRDQFVFMSRAGFDTFEVKKDADAEALSQQPGRTGVIWPNNRDLDDLVPWLSRLASVALVFPTFRDGRAYSQARLLRERHGYKGELRATGQVLRDQFVFMLRAGFDAFEVTKEADALAFPEAERRYSVFFQPAADRRANVFRARLRREAALAS